MFMPVHMRNYYYFVIHHYHHHHQYLFHYCYSNNNPFITSITDIITITQNLSNRLPTAKIT